MIATKDARKPPAVLVLPAQRTCEHRPPCPTAEATDREAALPGRQSPRAGLGAAVQRRGPVRRHRRAAARRPRRGTDPAYGLRRRRPAVNPN